MIGGPVLAGTLSAGAGTKVALLVDAGNVRGDRVGGGGRCAVRRQPSSRGASPTARARAGFSVVIRRDRMLLVGLRGDRRPSCSFAAMDNVAEVFFARDTLDAGAWGYGLLASVWLVGMAIGASLIARRLGKGRLLSAMAIAAVVGGAAVAIAGASGVLAVALVMFLVGGVANGVITVSMRSLIVHRTEDRYRGRVFAAYGGLMNGTQLIAIGAAGGLVAGLDGQTVLIIGGIGTAVAGIAGLLAYAAMPSSVKAMPGDEDDSSMRSWRPRPNRSTRCIRSPTAPT